MKWEIPEAGGFSGSGAMPVLLSHAFEGGGSGSQTG